MIIAVSTIQMRRMDEGVVASVGNTLADAGEFILTLDTGRLIIGSDPDYGSPYSNRTYFPYEAVEVLTEFSPKNQELFSLSVRDQDQEDFYLPITIANNGAWQDIYIQDYDGGLLHEILPVANNVSCAIEYHAFGGGEALTSGTLRILGSGTTIIANNITSISYPSLALGATYVVDQGFHVQAKNTSSAPITLRLRQVTFVNTANTANIVVVVPPQPNPPVWVTPSGSLGSFYTGNAISIQLSATDPNSLPVSYAVISGFLPNGTSMSNAGLITGTISTNTTSVFTVRASDSTGLYADRTFSVAISLSPPVWVTPAGSLGSYLVGDTVATQLSATDPNGLSLTYSVISGSLPGGTTMNSGGFISGTITGTASASFTVRADDGTLHTDRAFSVSVALPGPQVVQSQVLALSTNANTTVTMNTAVTVGNLLIAVVFGTNVPTENTGWTRLNSAFGYDAIRVVYRVAQAGDSQIFTPTTATGGGSIACWEIEGAGTDWLTNPPTIIFNNATYTSTGGFLPST